MQEREASQPEAAPVVQEREASQPEKKASDSVPEKKASTGSAAPDTQPSTTSTSSEPFSKKKGGKKKRKSSKNESGKRRRRRPKVTYDEIEQGILDMVSDAAMCTELWNDMPTEDGGDAPVVGLLTVKEMVSSTFMVIDDEVAFVLAAADLGLATQGVDVDDMQPLLTNLFYFHKLVTALGCEDDAQQISYVSMHEALAAIGVTLEGEQTRRVIASMPSFSPDPDGDPANDTAHIRDLCGWFRNYHTQQLSTENTLATISLSGSMVEPSDSMPTATTADQEDVAPVINGDEFDMEKWDVLENDILVVLGDTSKLEELWSAIGYNDNDSVHLSEVNATLTERFPLLNNHTAMQLAYQKSCETDAEEAANPDAWVEARQFPKLLAHVLYYNKIIQYHNFLDADDDGNVLLPEFQTAMVALGMTPDADVAKEAFDEIDSDSSGKVPMEQFVVWYTRQVSPEDEFAAVTAAFAEARAAKSLHAAETSSVPPSTNTVLPTYANSDFDELEVEVIGLSRNASELFEMFCTMDANRNKQASLEEIETAISTRFPLLHDRNAMLKAYTRTCQEDGHGVGDAWVTPSDFQHLLIRTFYYNKMFQCCASVDIDSNKMIDPEEFQNVLINVEMDLGEDGSMVAFSEIDTADDGQVTFGDICVWYTEQVGPTPQEYQENVDEFVALFDTDERYAAAGGGGDAESSRGMNIPIVKVTSVETQIDDLAVVAEGAGTTGTASQAPSAVGSFVDDDDAENETY